MLSHRGGFPMLDGDIPMETMFDRDAVVKIIFTLASIILDNDIPEM